MRMGVDNLVGLRCHGVFYTGFIYHGHQKGVTKGVLGLFIPIIWRNRKIWCEVLLKLRVYFYVLVSSKKIFSESIHRI